MPSENLESSLLEGSNEIVIDEGIRGRGNGAIAAYVRFSVPLVSYEFELNHHPSIQIWRCRILAER